MVITPAAIPPGQPIAAERPAAVAPAAETEPAVLNQSTEVGRVQRQHLVQRLSAGGDACTARRPYSDLLPIWPDAR